MAEQPDTHGQQAGTARPSEPSGITPSAESSQTGGAIRREELYAISDALARMVIRQNQIEARLARIEQAFAIAPIPAASPHSPVPAPETGTAPGPPPLPPEASAGTAVHGSFTDLEPAPATAPRPIEYTRPALNSNDGPSLETLFGLNWLNRIAVITLILGAGFFFKYAVDNAWIGPSMRVALGVAAGMAALSIGEWMTIRGQKIFARGVTGLGLALLYLSFYASFGFYDLLPQSIAFLLMTLTTAAAGALAFHYESSAVAILGLIGGFLTPPLLSTGEDRRWTLILYTLLLDAGALIFARWKRWPVLAYLSLIGTYLVYMGWTQRWLEDSTRMAALTWVTAAFALFLLFSRNTGPWLLAANAALYFATAYSNLNPGYRPIMGAFTLFLAAIHALHVRATRDRALRIASVATALVFLTLAIPIQFTGYRVTMGFALEAAAFAWIAKKLHQPKLEFGCGVLLFLVFARLLGRDSNLHPGTFFNARLLTFLIGAGAFFAAAKFLDRMEARRVTYCMGHVIALWALSLELSSWIERTASPLDDRSTITTAISILMGAYALALIAAGVALRSAIDRLLGLALIGLVVLKLYLVDVWQLSRGFRITALLALGALLLLISYLYSRFRPAMERLWRGDGSENLPAGSQAETGPEPAPNPGQPT